MAIPSAHGGFIAPAQVAELLQITVGEVIGLLHEGWLVGARVGSPASWRIETDSVWHYIEEQREDARRRALWRQSNNASFPELWGATGE